MTPIILIVVFVDIGYFDTPREEGFIDPLSQSIHVLIG
jgi:hypothetical protein